MTHDVMTRMLSVDLQRMVDEACALCLLLTELGFVPREVEVGARNVANTRPPGLWATVTVRRGGCEDVIAIAYLETEESGEAFGRAWNAFTAKPLESTEAIRMIRASLADQEKLVASLTAAGFVLKADGGRGLRRLQGRGDA